MLEKITPYLWLCAFLSSLFFVNAWQLELFGISILLVSLWSVFSLSRLSDNGFNIPQSWCLRIVGAFWLLTFLSILGSDVINVSVMAFCFFSVLPLTFFVMSLQDREGAFKIIAKILAVVFVILAVWAMIQFYFLYDYFDGRARHPLKNPNSLGALFSLAIFCGVGAVAYFEKLKAKKWAVAFTVLMMAALACTGGRGPLFALILVMAVFLFVMRGEVKDNFKLYLLLLLGSVGVFLLTLTGEIVSSTLIHRSISTVSGNTADITSNRLSLWLATWEIIKSHGVFGTGIGTYFLYFPEFRLPTDESGAYYAHSDPLQYWVELGVLGPVLFYTFIIGVTARTVKAVNQAVDRKQKLMVLTPFFAVAACVLHTHVTFNFYNLSILFTVGFLLSVWFVATQKVLQTPTKNIRFPESYSRASRTTLIALLFIFIVGIFGAYVVSEAYTNKARDHLLKSELEEFASAVMSANKISMDGNYRSYLLAVNVPMTLLQESGDKLTTDQKKEIFDQALSYLSHVQNINPRSASANFYLGKIQQLVPEDFIPEDLQNSQKYYERALELDPIHIGARIELSYIYERDLLSLDRAIALMEQGATYRYATSKEVDLYARLAQLYLKSGDNEGRDRAIQTMIAVKKRFDEAKLKEEAGFFYRQSEK